MSLTAPEHAAAILTFDILCLEGLYFQATYNAAGAKKTTESFWLLQRYKQLDSIRGLFNITRNTVLQRA